MAQVEVGHRLGAWQAWSSCMAVACQPVAGCNAMTTLASWHCGLGLMWQCSMADGGGGRTWRQRPPEAESPPPNFAQSQDSISEF